MFNVLSIVLSYFSSSPSLNIVADQQSSGGSLLNPTYRASLISAYIEAIVALCKSPNGMRTASLACFAAQTQPQNECRLDLCLNFSLYLLYPSRSSTSRSPQTLICLSGLTMDLASASTPHDASVSACVIQVQGCRPIRHHPYAQHFLP
jgi:hypothetical protein